MKQYLKPTVTMLSIETHSILAGSLSVGITDNPATGPACSYEKDEPGGSSLWSNL